MTTREMPRLSVQSLKVYEDCPRKFALRYQLNRYWPAADPDQLLQKRDGRGLGTLFHRAVEAHALGLDVTPLLLGAGEDAPALQLLWERFLETGYGAAPPGATVWTEQELNFTAEGVPCVVRLDRLVHHAGRWTIVDWKTGRPDPKVLEKSWQSRLYRYAVVEAGGTLGMGPVEPESISLVFWTAEGALAAIPYDLAEHARVGTALAAIALKVQAPFDPDAEDDPRFPRTPSHCARCVFHSYCNAEPAAIAPTQVTLPRFAVPQEDSWPPGS